MQCVVDEAHATGVYGHFGRGLTEHLNVSSERMIRIGTLSKAVGCVGGFVAGNQLLIDWLTNHARSWIYSTAMTFPNTLAAIRALSLVHDMQDERRLLEQKATSIRLKLNNLGFRVGSGTSPIIPVYLHDAVEVIEKCQRLLEQGIYVPAIRPPTVPAGTSLLRISLSAVHSEQELTQLVSAFQQL
jgi:8-amino-7-oxononanoate synthase